jgi:hypothetical protein
VSARKLNNLSDRPMRTKVLGGQIIFESSKGFLKSCCLQGFGSDIGMKTKTDAQTI